MQQSSLSCSPVGVLRTKASESSKPAKLIRCTSLTERRPSRISKGTPVHWVTFPLLNRRRPGCRFLCVRAISAPEAPTKTFKREFPIQTIYKLKIEVQEGLQQQKLTVWTDVPGRLLLHWGVEGGHGYTGGWRLPGSEFRPPDTVQYKDRALQTPFRQSGNGQEVVIELTGGEVSDYLDFVLKDESTNTWFDWNGDNFRVRLHDREEQPKEALISIDVQDLPTLPQELCGIWAYIKWEVAGCPNRSQHEADHEYQQAIEELKTLLTKGIPLEELWRVARGEGARYQDWIGAKLNGSRSPGVAAPPAPVSAAPTVTEAAPPQTEAAPPITEAAPEIPDSIVGIVAYLLWEKAGKPQGADFGDQAREAILKDIRNGKTLEQIEQDLKAPPPPPKQQAAAITEEVKAAAPPPQEVRIGPVLDRSSTIFREPLKFVKSTRPLLSMDKKKETIKPLTPLANAAGADSMVVWQRTFPLGSKAELLAVVRKLEDFSDGPVQLVLTTDIADPVVLHWGVKKGAKAEWLFPPRAIIPEGSSAQSGGIAVETEFGECVVEECLVDFQGVQVPLQRLVIDVPAGMDVSGLTFVMRSGDSTRWWKDGGSNFTVPIPGGKFEIDSSDPLAAFSDPLARAIVDAEVNSGMWTLMHRCNKAADLLSEVVQGYYDDVADSMAMIYVWLRYSAIRQLTWQRNYNTQPRILGAAQERLTQSVAKAYSQTGGEAQEWVRLMLGCVGRGGNAQAVRDEILNIMHRNHIPEKKETWMEQWHQKLHNNTTPDDVVICEAYLAFLESNGSMDTYWRVLKEGGVTRERLTSFERAVVCDPEFWPDKKGVLIKEFLNYLGILKAVHSGAELQSSAAAAGPYLPDGSKGHLGYVLANQGGYEILPLIQNAVECRAALAKVAEHGNREILYLDLALEGVVRSAAERGAGSAGMAAAPLVSPLLANLILSTGDNEELCYCLKAWEKLPGHAISGANPSQEDALKVLAVLDRIRRALATVSDKVSRRIQPISSGFGRAFGCDEWAVDLFAEEVIRGGPAFAVSLVLSSLEPALRSAANLSSWQVISPGSVTGRIVIVQGLQEIQDISYEEPTILVARRVTGEEEVPEGAVGLVSPDAPDVLAHLSVRTRNMHVLFAACHDQAPIDEIAALEGKVVSIVTTAGGGVKWSEGGDTPEGGSPIESPLGPKTKIKVVVPQWTGKWVVGMDEYKDGLVGAKSKNLAGLRGKLPDWINLPASVTLPFGVYEEVLKIKENQQLSKEIDSLVATVDLKNAEKVLAKCRSLANKVTVPPVLIDDLQAAMSKGGIPLPANQDRWNQALTALKGVWASKFNERAYISMRKVGLDFMDIRMAVLCQRVVPAKYAYVIHTRNPSTGDDSEVYCELVLGLGESIVSGMVPGSAIAFVAKKDNLDNPKVVLYPSKSDGMFVKESLIFRSDSNGEDLEGYAGAGLYDSITMDPTLIKRVDYMEDSILKDEGYRRQLMARICTVGAAIEDALGTAQDVEGVVDPDDNITVVQTRPQM